MKYNNDTNTFTFWASELVRLNYCGAAGIESKGVPSTAGDPAAIGNAIHECLELAAERGHENVNVKAVALNHQVDADDLQQMFEGNSWDPRHGTGEVRYAWAFEREDAHRTPPYRAEIVARLDWVYYNKEENAVEFIDYKTTWLVEKDPEPQSDLQLVAGALAVLNTSPAFEEGGNPKVRGTKLYLRRGDNGWSPSFQLDPVTAEPYERTLFSVLDRAVANWRAEKGDRRYRLSDHCEYCPGALTCPGKRLAFDKALAATRSWFPPTKKIDKTTGLPVPSKRRKTAYGGDVTLENVHELNAVGKMMKTAGDALVKECKAFGKTVGPLVDPEHPDKVLTTTTRGRRKGITTQDILDAAIATGASSEEAQRIVQHLDMRPRDDTEYFEVVDVDKLEQKKDEAFGE